MSSRHPKVFFQTKFVFWFLCAMTALVLYLESFGPETLLASDMLLKDFVHTPQIYRSHHNNVHQSTVEVEPVLPGIEDSRLNLLAEMTVQDEDKVDMDYVKEMLGIKPVPFNISAVKTILVWNNAYGSLTEGLHETGDEEELHRAGCPQPNCVVVANRTLMPVQDFDAIILHFRNTTLTDLPLNRTANQRWIFKETEPASYIYQWPHLYNGLFNWTMTYKINSDIPTPYGIFRKRKNLKSVNDSDSSVLPKPKMAAWFVSNCASHSGRELIATALQSFIQVDIYGECSALKCSRDSETECYEMLERDYKFYLSFENSLCKDYVTEKLFSVLKYRVIPVVFGSADYSAMAPPNSFINAFDFASIANLAAYLQFLAGNETAYNEYFRWKEDYFKTPYYLQRVGFICHLCYKLHQNEPKKVYENLDSWFLGGSQCRSVNTPSLAVKFINYLKGYFPFR